MTNPYPPIKQLEADRQRFIETRFEQFKARPQDRDRTMEDIFGPLEDWTLEIGRYQLLLLPLTGQWWYLHPLYETWENTGYKAGETTFYLLGELLEGQPLESVAAAPTPQAESPAQPAEAAQISTQDFSPPDRELEQPTMIAPLFVSWQLVAINGPHANDRYTLGDQTRLGRVAGNEIVLADPLTSRQHAKIQSVGGGYLLSDLNSQNGTYVNDQRIHEARQLALGDQIRIGDTVFEVAAV